MLNSGNLLYFVILSILSVEIIWIQHSVLQFSSQMRKKLIQISSTALVSLNFERYFTLTVVQNWYEIKPFSFIFESSLEDQPSLENSF